MGSNQVLTVNNGLNIRNNYSTVQINTVAVRLLTHLRNTLASPCIINGKAMVMRVSYLVVESHNLSTRITRHRPWEFVSQTTRCDQGRSLCVDFVMDLSDISPHFQLRVIVNK